MEEFPFAKEFINPWKLLSFSICDLRLPKLEERSCLSDLEPVDEEPPKPLSNEELLLLVVGPI